jgi:methylglutaconyl-CoA hydratase
MSETPRVRLEASGPVARITLARPEVRNAFDDVLIAELTRAARILSDAFETAAAAETGAWPASAPRVTVLTGDGAVFCAGADLNWMKRSAAYTRQENDADARRMAAMVRAIDELPMPVIARVNGPALGGGMGLLAACDIVIAAEGASFGFTEVRLGIAPAVISSFVLPKIGAAAARRYFLTGETFDAEAARAMGLVHAVVPAERLDAEVDALAQAVLACGPRAVATAKRLIREATERTRDDAVENAVRVIAALRVSSEGQEGLGAFLEKRRPSWRA